VSKCDCCSDQHLLGHRLFRYPCTAEKNSPPPPGNYVRRPLFKTMLFSPTINFKVLHSNLFCHRTNVILRHNYGGKVEGNLKQEWNESMLAVMNKMVCMLVVVVVCCAGEMKNESNKKD